MATYTVTIAKGVTLTLHGDNKKHVSGRVREMTGLQVPHHMILEG